MLRVSDQHVVYDFEPGGEAAVTAPLGVPFVVETRDALDGQVREGESEIAKGGRPNPATGPIAFEAVAPGDTLRIDVLAIDPAPKGYLTFGRTPQFFRQEAGLVHFVHGLRVPMEPMIGTIGVMPASGKRTSKEAGDHGGNMDTRDVAAGCSLFLSCQVEGGGLALGDVHSVQADGETSGQGIETAATVTLRVEKASRCLSARPYLIRNGRLMVVVSSASLDQAAKDAVEETAAILEKNSKLDYREARMLIGVVGDLRVGQIVNPQKTVRISVPLDIVPWDSTADLT